MINKWTEEKLEWIRQNKNLCSSRQNIVDRFNEEFNTNVSFSSLISICKKRKISLNYEIAWGDKVEWLKNNKHKYNDREDILNALNRTFGLELTLTQLQHTNTRFKLKLPHSNRRIKNNLKNLQTPKEIGSEVIKHDKDRIYIKTGEREYVAKQRYLYEKYHNVKLSKSDLIIFLDDDKNNYNKENLYRITKTMMGIMVGNELTNINVMKKHEIIKFVEWKEKINRLKEITNEA